jgi:hypothetical protein
MGNPTLKQQTFWRYCWMMKRQPYNSSTSSTKMIIFPFTLECLKGRYMHVDVTLRRVVLTFEATWDGIGVNRDTSVKSKILSHFIKGKISFSPMETILMIPRALEHLESLVRLAKWKKDLEASNNQVFMVSAVPTLKKICINNTHRNKALHLLVELCCWGTGGYYNIYVCYGYCYS